MESKIPLFSGEQLYSILQKREKNMFAEIDNIDSNTLLNTSVNDWADYFDQQYKLEVPQLKEDRTHVAHEEVLVPVNYFYEGWIQKKGTQVSIFVPFDGEKDLFRYQPSSLTMIYDEPIYAKFNEREIILNYQEYQPEASSIKFRFERELSNISENLKNVANQVLLFNNSIRAKAINRLEFRHQKILKDKDLVDALGFPLKRRDDASQTYVVPTMRRRVSIARPSAGTDPFVPEPSLDMQEYEHILSVISNMVMVMERSPQTFKSIGEEDLRQHFLVQLNGHYEGQATGETFNLNGKTDILIRVEGKNIFIAECKFWSGKEKLQETIEQLLGYTSWRDTKIALMIFNRNKSFSNVVKQIPEVIRSHSNFKRELFYDSETGFRCILHHPDDVNRELILTTLAFNMPQE